MQNCVDAYHPAAEADFRPDGRDSILIGAILLGTLAYSFRFTSFLHAKEVVWCAAIAVLGALACLRGVSRCGLRPFLPLWGLLLLIVPLQLIFSPVPVPSMACERITYLALCLLVPALAYPAIVDDARWTSLRRGIALSAVCAGLLALLQYAGLLNAMLPPWEPYHQKAYSVFGNQNLLGGYMAMGLPIAVAEFAAARGKRAALFAFAILVIFAALLISQCRGAWIAAIAGLLAGIPASASKRHLARIGVTALIAGVALAAFTAVPIGDRVAQLFAHEDQGRDLRRWFYAGTWQMVRSHPIAGIGPGQFAYSSPQYLGEVLHHAGRGRFAHNAVHTVHAHCDPLEWLAEFGVLGGIVGLWMSVRIARRATRGAELGVLCAFAVFSLTNFPMASMTHTIAAVLVAARLLMRGQHAPPSASRPLGIAIGLLAIALAFFYARTSLLPSYWLRAADARAVAQQDSIPLYQRAVKDVWPNPLAEFRYGLALEQAGRTGDAISAMRRALTGLDTAELHQVLGAFLMKTGQFDEARDHLEKSLWRAPGSLESYVLLYRASPREERTPIVERARQWLDEETFARFDAVAETR